MNTSFFGELLQTISERGRALRDASQDVAMPEVNAVERADGDHRTCRELR